MIAVHVSSIIITHLQEHKATVLLSLAIVEELELI
jgi:hypothetical protein